MTIRRRPRRGRLAAALVLAGGVGNLIDRAVFGFVTDMFKTTFIDFAVFNVADCCITVGVPLLFLYVLLYMGKDEKKEGGAYVTLRGRVKKIDERRRQLLYNQIHNFLHGSSPCLPAFTASLFSHLS